MSDIAAFGPIGVEPGDADLFSRRLSRGWRRIGAGLRLVRLGLWDIAVGATDGAALLVEDLARALLGDIAGPAVAIARAIYAMPGWIAAAVRVALGALLLVGAAVARPILALILSPARVLALWARWARQAVRLTLSTLAYLASAIGRFLLQALIGALALLVFLAATPALGLLFDLIVRTAAAGGADLSHWISTWAPSAQEIAAPPWANVGDFLARLALAAAAVLLVGAAVSILAFGLWLLALSAYVAGRSLAAVAPPVVRGARRAGVTARQAAGFIAFLLGKIGGEALLLLIVAGFIAGMVWLASLGLSELGRLPVDWPGVRQGVAALAIVLGLIAVLLALVLLARLFAGSAQARRSLLVTLLAVAVAAPLVWLVAQPGLRSSVQAFVEACANFVQSRTQFAQAEAAVAPRELVAPPTPAEEAARLEESAPVLPRPRPTAPAPASDARPEGTPAVVAVYAGAPNATWAWGRHDRLAGDGDAMTALRAADVDASQACAAGALLAVGAASSDGGRARNEALAFARALQLGGVAEAAVSQCGGARPSVWVLSLGQSLIAPPDPSQRAPALLALEGGPAVPLDQEGRIALELPFDRLSYSAERLCLLAAGSSATEIAGGAPCPLAAD